MNLQAFLQPPHIAARCLNPSNARASGSFSPCPPDYVATSDVQCSSLIHHMERETMKRIGSILMLLAAGATFASCDIANPLAGPPQVVRALAIGYQEVPVGMSDETAMV